METIVIHKKNALGENFNPYQYQKEIASRYPEAGELNHRYAAEKIGKAYTKLKEFDTNTDDNTITRNIIKQGDVYAEFSTETQKNANVIQSDVIILGKKHNWSRFSDVVITKFNNYKREYPREVLDYRKKLIAAQYFAYRIQSMMERFHPDQELPPFTRGETAHIKREIDNIMEPSKFALVADFCNNMYKVEINVANFSELYNQLLSVGLVETLYRTQKEIAKIIGDRIKSESLNFGQMMLNKEKLDEMSSYNLLQKILMQEYDSESEVFLVFKKFPNITVNQFYEKIPKKEVEKIKKIIGDRLKIIYQKPCVHNDLVKKFLSGKKHLREKVIEMCDMEEKTMQWKCQKCSERAFCQHHLEKSMKKSEFISKYKSAELSDRIIYYCKYCGEKIYKNETEYVLNSADFVAISKVRENSLSRETNIDIFDSGLYSGINAAIQEFKIGYEYSQQSLAKSIKQIIYGMVHDQITKLSIEEDSQFELITKMYAFIFTLVYMRPLFMKDPKVSTLDGTSKKDSAYGNFINQEVSSKFKSIANSEKTLNIIKTAIVRIRDSKADNVKIYAKTEKDSILEIIQSKKFLLLYQYYNYGNPGTTILDAFPKIVKKLKPNLSNFSDGLVIPNKNVNETERNIYTHLFDYNSPYCYIYNLSKNETLGNSASNSLVYDPKIYNLLAADYKKSFEEMRLKSYKDVLASPKDRPFGIAYGPNFMYDDEGNIIEWKPMGAKKDWEYTSPSGKTYYLSKIKASIDRSTDEKIKTRNKVLGFTKANFVAKPRTKGKEISKPEAGKYEFNKKMISVATNLDSKFNHHMVENLGRTEYYEYHNMMKGLIPNAESFVIGSDHVNKYIQYLLEKYFSLRNYPLSPVNATFFEKNNIDFNKSQSDIKKLPVPNFGDYFREYKKRVTSWDPKKFYYWNLESLLGFCDEIIKSGPIGKAFCTGYFEEIFAEDRKISVPDERKIILSMTENKLDEADYDEYSDFAKKTTALQEIDYEEDEDDINDFS